MFCGAAGGAAIRCCGIDDDTSSLARVGRGEVDRTRDINTTIALLRAVALSKEGTSGVVLRGTSKGCAECISVFDSNRLCMFEVSKSSIGSIASSRIAKVVGSTSVTWM